MPKDDYQHLRIASFLLCGFALILPIALGISQAFLFLAILYAVFAHLRGFESFRFKSRLAIPVIAFIAMILIGILTSTRFSVSLGKIHRVLYFAPIFMLPALAKNQDGLDIPVKLLRFFVYGSSIYFVYDVLRIILHVHWGGDLFDAGSMTVPQLYMTSLLILCAMDRARIGQFINHKNSNLLYALLLIINSVGLLMHFKRGAWLATIICLGLLLIIRARWKSILMIALACLALLALPQVRERVAQLPDEFAHEQGGRWALWTEVAPSIISEYPWGMGWQAVRHNDLAEHTGYLQDSLNHLHNSLMQVTLELGIPGGILWSYMMLSIIACLAGNYITCRRKNARDIYPDVKLAALMAVLSLFLNGFVEDNFNRSEIALLYYLMAGISLSLSKQTQEFSDKSELAPNLLI